MPIIAATTVYAYQDIFGNVSAPVPTVPPQRAPPPSSTPENPPAPAA